MDEKIITHDNLISLIDELIKANNIVIAQDKKAVGWKKITSAEEIILSSDGIPSNLSYKEFVFSKTEPIIYFKSEKDNYELVDNFTKPNKLVFLGAKPCDARSIEIMSKVFNWDYKDKFFNERAENSIVIGAACSYVDEFCFCTSVGLSPATEAGSDLFLVKLNDKEYSVKIVSDEGKEFIKPFEKLLTAGNPDKTKAAIAEIKEPAKKFETEKVREWLTTNFEHKLFDEIGSTCVGCGQCAFACPVCHCFDIVDEECNYSCGRRMKNWDACQFGIFTLHGSGHNPRETQGKRYRQRVAHKFKYYTDKFNEVLCTGCGRCSRGCPVGIDIGNVVTEIFNIERNACPQ